MSKVQPQAEAWATIAAVQDVAGVLYAGSLSEYHNGHAFVHDPASDFVGGIQSNVARR
jgi:hypothetical protein